MMKRRNFTKGCGVECRQLILNAFSTCNHRFALSISNEHYIRLLSPHFQVILLIPIIIYIN